MSRHRHKDSERKLEMTSGTDNFQRWKDKDSQVLARHHDYYVSQAIYWAGIRCSGSISRYLLSWHTL